MEKETRASLIFKYIEDIKNYAADEAIKNGEKVLLSKTDVIGSYKKQNCKVHFQGGLKRSTTIVVPATIRLRLGTSLVRSKFILTEWRRYVKTTVRRPQTKVCI